MRPVTPTERNVPTTHRINAKHLQLALVARKARPTTRWAALSNGIETNDCQQRHPGWRFTTPPMLVPMSNGRMSRLVRHVREFYGLAEVRTTWGQGLRAMQAEASRVVLPS